ncbi:hypothetical protein [Marinimicrobium locisalis]|uniref:hypothetical protein n=1 Tax=Marinimicrobium locisalis TaxID=546022 RepID=UPI0032218C98
MFIKRLFSSRKRPYFKNLDRLESLSLDLSGTRLELELPPQDYPFPEKACGSRFDIHDLSLYEYEDSLKEGYHRSDLGHRLLFQRKWELHGEFWKSSGVGLLMGTALLSDAFRLGEKVNCFNRELFERIIRYQMYFSYGPGGYGQYKCPVNWSVKRVGDTDWIYFEAWRDEPGDKYNPQHSSQFYACFFSPIDHTALFN